MGRISGFSLTGTFVHTKPGSILQSAEQPSPLTVLPSSHCFPSPGRSKPLPQTLVQAPPIGGQDGSRRQKGEQPSPLTVLPSSHCSDPSLMLFPQTVVVQVVGPVQPLAAFGEVQSHPSGCDAGLLSSVQMALQPSPSVLLPS